MKRKIPKISIIHPSYRRPYMASDTAKKWLSRAAHPGDIEYILCLAGEDMLIEEYKKFFADLPVRIVYHAEANMVKQVNYAATLTKGNLLVDISDDFDCPQHWDTLLLSALSKKKDYIVKTKDGLQGFIITLPIMDRAYYKRFGYIYNPEYNHMYGDEELAYVGKLLNRTITLEIMFPHLHYTTKAMKKDDVNVRNDSFYAIDRVTFKRRQENNFGL